MTPTTSTVDLENLKEFTSRAQDWWDPEGPFKPLHALNPTRLHFLSSQIAKHFSVSEKDFQGLSLLDVGCGGGLVTEPLAQKNAQVTGLDAGVENIDQARQHAVAAGLSISYVPSALEDFHPATPFDCVLALEIVEHVTCVQTFIGHCFRVLRPGGLLITSTLNRTLKSFALGIVGAEYLLNWVPRGTHDWRRFLKPSELAAFIRGAGGQVQTLQGLTYHPFSNSWRLSSDQDVNYFLVATNTHPT